MGKLQDYIFLPIAPTKFQPFNFIRDEADFRVKGYAHFFTITYDSGLGLVGIVDRLLKITETYNFADEWTAWFEYGDDIVVHYATVAEEDAVRIALEGGM